MPVAVELRDVSFAYNGGSPVLEHVSLAVEAGEFVAIAGPNGGGKTTLMRLALGLERPASGEALLFGEPAARFSGRSALGYLAQRSQLGVDAPATVREVVAAGRLASGGLLGPLRRRDRAIVSESIERVGLADSADLPLRTLSGGQQQRAFIARAFASEPDLLVLDEPIAGVDAESQRRFRDSLTHLIGDHGAGVLLVSHELSAVADEVDRVIVLKRRVLFDGPPDELMREGVSLGIHREDLPLWLEGLG
jgi:zinc transport system ATP-binding protein